MPSASASGIAANRRSSLIFSQRDQEIRRFRGSQCSDTSVATESAGGRVESVQGAHFSLSEQVIGACIEVHRLLGPGLLESIYEECVCRELALRGLPFERQKPIPLEYKGSPLEQHYRADLVVRNALLLEIKAVEALLPIHSAQVVTYLRVSGLSAGLLVNFNAVTIRSGLRRLWRNPKIS